MTEDTHLSATRAFYDAVAEEYVRLVGDELDRRPLERGLLAAFAEVVLADGGGPVADLGCGPGRLTPFLVGLGLDAFGVDLSPRMVELARSRHPGLRFEVGSLTGLDLADGTLAGALAWYSVIHREAGLEVRAETVRAADADERQPQAFLLARRLG